MAISWVVAAAGLSRAMGAEPMCNDAAPERPAPGTFFAAFNTTADGASDGTVGISLPDSGGPFEYVVVARIAFDEHLAVWEDGPSAADAGSYVTWWPVFPANAVMTEGQYDYLSDLNITVELYEGGAPVARVGAGHARVAFESGAEPLVLLPAEAEELAPGGNWNLDAAPRTGLVAQADVPQPPLPDEPDLHSNSEEVAP
jgi:hypothetical protein